MAGNESQGGTGKRRLRRDEAAIGTSAQDPMPLADRLLGLEASGIRRVFERARRIPGVVDLSLGQTCLGIGTVVRKAAGRALEEDDGRYGPTEGLPQFLEALGHHVAREFGPGGENLIATAGISAGFHLACQALFQSGDEVLIPDPGFVAHAALIELTGARAVRYDTYPDFRLRRAALESVLTPRTRAVVVCNPGNPGGAVATLDELRGVVEFAHQNRLRLLSDEAYAQLVHRGEHVSVRRLDANALLFSGFSKSHAIAGWRLGFVQGPAEIIEQLRTLQQFIFMCAPTVAQRTMAQVLQDDNTEMREAVATRRDVIVRELGELLPVSPEGGLFAFVPAPWGTGTEFADRCLEEKLAIVPGRCFSRRDTHVRITYSADSRGLERGLEIFKDVARRGTRS
ncbi:MAG: aspartate aminotransferase [Planctomycetes bacterium]|nr:aspartate aminotransferase [Planctomycetota bacterium]